MSWSIARANQLAAGLSLLFFGLGVSALIGKSYVGATIIGLPRFACRWPQSARGDFDVLVWLALPTALLLVVAAVPHALGPARCARSARIRRRPSPPVQPAGSCSTRRSSSAALLGGSPARTSVAGRRIDLGRGNDRGARLHRHRARDLRAMESVWAVAGALVFGGAEALQLQLQARGLDVSPFLMNMLPYLLTLLVLSSGAGDRPVRRACGARPALFSVWNSRPEAIARSPAMTRLRLLSRSPSVSLLARLARPAAAEKLAHRRRHLRRQRQRLRLQPGHERRPEAMKARPSPASSVLEAENVPETAEAERVMEGMIQQGAKLIFATSFGHQQFAFNLAKHASGRGLRACRRLDAGATISAISSARRRRPGTRWVWRRA